MCVRVVEKQKNNYEPIYVSDDIQEKVHHLRYHPVGGVKAVSSPVSSKAKYILEEAVDSNKSIYSIKRKDVSFLDKEKKHVGLRTCL